MVRRYDLAFALFLPLALEHRARLDPGTVEGVVGVVLAASGDRRGLPFPFAYGVAWVQTWLSRKGFWEGILSATLLWTALALTTMPSMTSLPRDLLVIEAGYTLVATILIGALVGGLSGKLVLPGAEKNRLEA